MYFPIKYGTLWEIKISSAQTKEPGNDANKAPVESLPSMHAQVTKILDGSPAPLLLTTNAFTPCPHRLTMHV